MNIDETLKERGNRYGEFENHASISQQLKNIIRLELSFRKKTLAEDQTEALEMICHKIARIINGDPDYIDSWTDISGYSTLIVKRLEAKK